jgi:hypothetical protein
MIKLNKYINEAWGGVKKQSLKQEIESWCEDMGIKNYTINSKGEIDVDGDVDLDENDFKKLPYKFGRVTGYFTLSSNKELTSLKNCPDKVGTWFSCSHNPKIDSLKGCPAEVGGNFWCGDCKRKFIKQEVVSFCKTVKGEIYNK